MRYKDKLIPLDTKTVHALYAVGDIHGNFMLFADDLINSCKVKNCAVIVCGDIGLGFLSFGLIASEFEKIEVMLAKRNIFVIFFRGNHDDPSWFEYKDDTFADNFPHIIIAEDFIVADYQKKSYSYKTLLWGGGISIDRKWRIEGMSYWKNEDIVPLHEELFDKYSLRDIDFVCTHIAPDFCQPYSDKNLKDIFRIDSELKEDLANERKILSSGAELIYNHNKDTLITWVYGHYHNMYYGFNMNAEMESKCPGVHFIGLDMIRTSNHSIKDFNKSRYDFYNRKHKNHIITLFNIYAKA